MIYENYDLIITTNNIKKEIIKSFSLNKKLVKTKVMSLNELNNLLLGTLGSEAIIFLMKEFNLSYNYAKMIIKNISYNSDKLNVYYNSLKENNYITSNNFVFDYNNVLVINVLVDKHLINLMNNPNISYLELDNNYIHDIYEFDNIKEEVSYVATKITDLLKNNIDINNIKLVNVDGEYNNHLFKIFKDYNIPLILDEDISVIKTMTFNKFYKHLLETKNIKESLSIIPKDEIYDKLVNYFNKLNISIINDITIKCIKDELSKISISKNKLKNSIKIINIEDILYDDKYYFILNINQGKCPVIKKDEDFFSDSEKKYLKLSTSLEINNFRKNLFINIYSNTKNLYLSYKLNSSFNSYMPSSIIDELNINVIKDPIINNIYSNKVNKYKFTKMLDDLLKYGIYNKDLDKYNYNYKLDYLKYSNKFTGINYNFDEINLSYSSINEYYLCGFNYYIKKVLKLDEFEESLAIIIGNVFHFVLSKMYNDNFNLEYEFNQYLKDNNYDKKTNIILNNLLDELKIIIKNIKELELNSNLKNNLLEENFEIRDIIPGKVHLTGFIDKLKHNDDKTIGIVLDYKTGSISQTLDNINYGLNLQLPIYIYLVNNTFKNMKVSGFYLQKILDNPKVDEDVSEKIKSLKLEGYTTSNINILNEIDKSYETSEYIKSMRITSKGFGPHTKVLSDDDILKVEGIAKNKVLEAANLITNGEFDINPKNINQKNVSCIYCKFSDLCFKNELDEVLLDKVKIKDILEEVK